MVRDVQDRNTDQKQHIDMNRARVLRDPWLAGTVLRYHTWPVHRQQSVGEHTWQVLRIYTMIFGPPNPDVVNYILWHDAGELVVGDSPFPFKKDNPSLKEIYDREEAEAVRKMGGVVPTLTSDQLCLVKVCDLLEMWDFGRHERSMGNLYADPIIFDTFEAVQKLQTTMDKFESYLVQSYIDKIKGE